ncbi:hypothetical protein Glove_402g101 [Diversispora epigaea]|uniref:Uncharacterized protein n=1 Tax=Diversispora epigaea TaxID=1348612 RepID=A0A397GZB9_9GLOM|nr:hypothetical protein Glove_402g101 [Diversispora epigaea]
MQKYSKKGGGKRILKKVWNLLQEYFLEGNIDKSERHTAESMFFQLKQCAENGIIDKEEIPKLETIRNWISRYASQYRQEAAIFTYRKLLDQLLKVFKVQSNKIFDDALKLDVGMYCNWESFRRSKNTSVDTFWKTVKECLQKSSKPLYHSYGYCSINPGRLLKYHQNAKENIESEGK